VLPSRVAVEFGIPAVLGAFAGAILNRHADPGVLLLAFGLLMLVAAAAMLRTAPAVHLRLRPRHALLSAAAGLGAGFLSGFFGVGGGFAGALAAGRAGGRIRDERLLRGFALLVAATAVFLIVENLGAVA
jgi:uncharacterized membrane protein YfcA